MTTCKNIWIGLVTALLLLVAPAIAQNTLGLTAWQVTGSLTAQTSTTCGATTCVVMPVNAIVTGVGWQITGTFSGTVTFEGSVDGVNYVATAVVPVGATRTLTTTATAAGVWQQNVTGYSYARVRCSAFTSGTIVVTGKRSSGPPPAQ